MLSESGRVIAVEADGVWVETLKLSACGQCRARHGCGQKLLATAESNLSCIKALFPNDMYWPQPKLGDAVHIGIEEGALVLGALLSYGIPLLLMLLFVGMVAQLQVAEVFVALAALVGLVLGGLIVRWKAQTLEVRRCFQAVLLPASLVEDQFKGTKQDS